MHEAQMHEFNSFITLTYSDDYLKPSLDYRDFQLFMKRLRRLKGGVRFFMCGEYGKSLRPHFHALLFGCEFSGLDPVGKNLFRSAELERLWPFGYSSIGDVSYESAGYVARYSCKKVAVHDDYRRVDLNTGEIIEVVPEFGHMSLGRRGRGGAGGIGYSWFVKHWREVYVPRDGVVLKGGRVCPPPRYYDELMAELSEDLFEHRKAGRYVNAGRFADEGTPERLAVREICARAKLAFKSQRGL